MAETDVTAEGPPQIIMNPIITGIISIVGVVDDKDFFCWEVLDNAPEIYIRITDEKNSCYNLVSSALNKKRIEHFVFLKENLNYCLDSNHFRDDLNFPLLVLYMEV